MKKLLKTVYYILLGCLVVIALLLIVSVFPITGNFKVLTVLSGSMEPAIGTGSVVVVKPSDNYGIGDVITFGEETKTKTPTTHRIYEMRVQSGEPIYITKGDANNAPDQKEIMGDEIIGKVLFNVPYAGYAVNEARKPLGFALIIILPALIIIGDELRKIWKEIMRLKNKKKDKEQDKEIDELKEEIKELKKR